MPDLSLELWMCQAGALHLWCWVSREVSVQFTMELSEYLWGRHPLKFSITMSHLVFQKLSPVLSKDPICGSVAKSCPALHDPMDRSMPGFPVPHRLLAFVQVHVHWRPVYWSSRNWPVYFTKLIAEDEMAGWHHRLDGHEFEQAPGVGDGQGSLTCCSPWGRRVRHDWAELGWAGPSRAGPGRAGPGWAGLGWAGLSWPGL